MSGREQPPGTGTRRRSVYDRVRPIVPLLCAVLLLPTAISGDRGWWGWAGVAVLLLLQVVTLVAGRRGQ
ncbi:hypothetical protein [Janibacter alittae]|uniref:Uncharacterized protein n=1 Tax=Janibacter alittae TaxID=3115209 RepID=A0ABZ2MH58_9MICO